MVITIFHSVRRGFGGVLVCCTCRYDAEAPERAPVPAYEERLSKFERMCIVKVRRHTCARHPASIVLLCCMRRLVLGPRACEVSMDT